MIQLSGAILTIVYTILTPWAIKKNMGLFFYNSFSNFLFKIQPNIHFFASTSNSYK